MSKKLEVLTVSWLKEISGENHLTLPLTENLPVNARCLETRTLKSKFKCEKVPMKSMFMTHCWLHWNKNSPRNASSTVIFWAISGFLRNLGFILTKLFFKNIQKFLFFLGPSLWSPWCWTEEEGVHSQAIALFTVEVYLLRLHCSYPTAQFCKCSHGTI